MTSEQELDAIGVALLVAHAIERAGGEYFVGGSLASSLQGEPRSTNDVDFVVSLPLGRLADFQRELGSSFELDVDMLRHALIAGSSANAFHLPTVTKIDLFGVGPSAYDEVEFGRRRRVQLSGAAETLVVKAPEDTVLRKLLWYEAGGRVSDRQWRDVVAVLRISGEKLDRAYLCSWSERLGVAELLQRAWNEADR